MSKLTPIRPIAFYPASVMFETPQHAQLLEKVGVRQLVSDVIDELITLATAQGCQFPSNFKQSTIDKMTAATDTMSNMYQDFLARRPMEIETYLGSPIRLATECDVKLPRIETLYAMLHHINITNQARPPQDPSSPVAAHPPRLSSAPSRPSPNGVRGRPYPGPGMLPPGPRRGAPSVHNVPRAPNGHPPPPHRQPVRDASGEDHGLEEFSHLMLYEDAAEDDRSSQSGGYPTQNGSTPSAADLALKERELALRQRELRLREQELQMRRPPNGRRMSSNRGPGPYETEEDGYFDPMANGRGPPMPPPIDPDNFDMMSVTSRRTRKKQGPSPGQFRKNPEMGGSRPPSSFSRHFGGGRHRASARVMDEIPVLGDSLFDNPMMAYSSNRYGNVDRKEMQAESRANSMTASRAGDYPPGMPHPPSRRTSQSPGHPMGPGGRGRPNTAHDPYMGPPSGAHGGRPSPPGAMRAPIPRHPSGQGNGVAPHQVEQYAGIHESNMNGPYPSPNPPPI